MDQFNEAAKALVRASYTQGRYTGPDEARESVIGIAAWLRTQAPAVGPVSRDDAAALLARGDVHVTKLVRDNGVDELG